MKTIREYIDLIENAQNQGSVAAVKDKPYSSNPYPKGSKEHLEWSKGHNATRARRLAEPKEQDIDEDQATAKMGLMSAMGSNDDRPDRQRMAAQAIERMADNK